MKNYLKNPCKQCPFIKGSLKGWLGGETVESTLDFYRNEDSFSCHNTRETNDETFCRGYLLFYKKACKVPKYNQVLKEALNNIEFKEAFNNSNVLSEIEFKNYHTI